VVPENDLWRSLGETTENAASVDGVTGLGQSKPRARYGALCPPLG
jgi:hypothetical protein